MIQRSRLGSGAPLAEEVQEQAGSLAGQHTSGDLETMIEAGAQLSQGLLGLPHRHSFVSTPVDLAGQIEQCRYGLRCVQVVVHRFDEPAPELFGVLIGTVFFILLTWKSATFFWQSWLMKESEPSLIRFPIYPSKLVMLLGAGLMTLQLLLDLYQAASVVLKPEQPAAQD